MNLENLRKAEEIRRQIEELEQFISWKPKPFEKMLLVKKRNIFRLVIESYLFVSEPSQIYITSEILSDAIKKALQQVIDDLKAQLVELGVEVE
jgi:hypothetical protein